MTTTCTIKNLELMRSTESGSFMLRIDVMELHAADRQGQARGVLLR